MSAHRVEYTGEGISEDEVATTPFEQARRWVDDALARQQERGDTPEPLALSVATVDEQRRPDVRTVLMRFFDPTGPGFVTNLGSAKGIALQANPAIAGSLTWPGMFRAIRFRGTAEVIGREELSEYFRQRPWGSRISAWASNQSKPAESRETLEQAYREYAARYPDHGREDDVPVPDFWGGYRIACERVEFWGGRRNRLHDRLVFERVGPGELDDAGAWGLTRLQP